MNRNQAADVVQHPVRSRIVRSFVGTERRTVGELTQLLPDVPLASLYRHLRALVDHQVLKLTTSTERRGNDTSRHRYALAQPSQPTGHRQATVYLDDTEFDDLLQALTQLFDQAVGKKPTPGRRPRLLATVAVPLEAAETTNGGR
jgi:hypothetical protein